jgi:hypothetical protein
MIGISQLILYFCLLFIFPKFLKSSDEVYLSIYPPGCDKQAAAQCEYEFLLCKLFNGPANDVTNLCDCATKFYGSCLRLAGVRII